MIKNVAFGIVLVVALGVLGAVIVGVGPFARPGQNSPPSQALTAYITGSIDTTASLPGSPYTQCTSLSLPGILTQSGLGVVWSTSNAKYQSGRFITYETINTALASGASGFISSTCMQMSFTFQYKQVPSIQGVLQKLPFLLKIESIGYTVMTTNNQTTVNLPVFAKLTTGITGSFDWGILIRDQNSAWHPACGEYSGQEPLPTGGCGWVGLGSNDGSNVATFMVTVIINRVGPFGYDTIFSPINKVDSVKFEVGLPEGQAGSVPGYYLPSQTFSLDITRS